MGEPLLAAPLQTLLDKLVPLLNFAHLKEFRSELRTWKSKLLQLRLVLCDAEQKQLGDPQVKKWLDNLRDLAYNVDDVLEELRHEALQRQNNSSSSDSAASSSQVQDLLAQMQEITTSFLDIEADKSDLRLEERPGVRSSIIITNRSPTTSLVDSSQIVGREKEIDAILKLLDIGETTKAKENQNRVGGMGGSESNRFIKQKKLESLILEAPCSETLVIPIVGMGGVGKTTLAQCIYNHSTLKKAFDCKAWACVSDNFDIIGLTKAILRQVTDRDAANDDDLNLLQVRLKEKISGRRFLIVLDDVWSEEDGEWENLFMPLKFGRPGSVVIVTTRSSKVVSITRSTSPYPLKLLKYDECLSIFARRALRAENFDAHPNLKVIGEKLVRRCDGLPLAAKTLGGLLGDHDQAKWEEVYGSSLWSGSISEKIAPALWLSFNYLPSHLKRCFVYCSIFPKDYEFDEEKLILLWMAEGFLGEPNEEKQMEDLGHEYFHDLLSRSLLQQSSHDSTKFVMHDLIHDLAQIVAGRVCFRIEEKEAEVVDIAVRHLSYCHDLFGPSKKFEVLKNTKRLRTLLALPTQNIYSSYFMNFLPQLRYVRVLSLSSYKIDELSSSVGDLKHLRYLNLSYTCIKYLPESLCDLPSLQSLILRGCRYLQQLPLRLKDLANLRYLDISHTHDLQELPPHVDLKFVQKLRKFVMGVLSGRGPRKECHLPGGLMMSILGKVEDVENALVINLMNKKNIEELKFEWERNLDNTENAESQVQILNLLEPPKMLRNLVIKGYSGVTLPNWIGDSSYSKLVELSLINWIGESFGSDVLPSTLKKLFIWNCRNLESISEMLLGPTSLDYVYFEKCPNLKSLPQFLCTNLTSLRIDRCESIESFRETGLPSPNLTYLAICYCKNLKHLPSNLQKLTSLRYLFVVGCDNLVSLPEGGLAPSLQHLEFGPCAKVEKQMWDELAPHKLPCLTSLSIHGGFRDVVCFPFRAQESQSLLPPTLASLFIEGFSNLESLSSSAFQNLTFLARLDIWDCPKLQSLPIEALPPSLRWLWIERCPELTPKCEVGGEYWPHLSLIPIVLIEGRRIN